MNQIADARLYYVHDPMCSWCWGFRPVWQQVRQQLPAGLQLVSWVGGLAPDSDVPMPLEMREKLQATWQRIQQVIPGTEFNYDFWRDNTPRRSTYPACRAVIAARELADKADQMTLGIQQAYYLQARNPSDLDTLTDTAVDIGLQGEAFIELMTSPQMQELFQRELQQVRAIGVNSFPSIVLEIAGRLHDIKLDYNSAPRLLASIQQLVNT